MDRTMRGWGLALLLIGLIALGAAWWKARSAQQVAQSSADDESLMQLESRMPGHFQRFFNENHRIPRAGDSVELNNLPPFVQSWRLLDQGLVEVQIKQGGKQQTLRWVPVVAARRGGLSYVPAGPMSQQRRMLHGNQQFLTEDDIAAQLALNEARMFDGQAEPGVPARRHGLLLSAGGSTQLSCANVRPLLCAKPHTPARLTPAAMRASELPRLLDADEVCATQFGRGWALYRSRDTWSKPLPAGEGWAHDSAPTAANCWASP